MLPEAFLDRMKHQLGEEYEVNPEEFATKGRATPFAGHKVYGKCLLNVCGGKEVYKAE